MKTKKLSMRFIAMLIVAIMMIGVMTPVVHATNIIEQLNKENSGDDTLHYVSLGASNTNGYGHHGYLDSEIYEDPLAAPKANMNDYGYDKAPANAYPALIKNALEEKTGRDVDLHQLAISSMRVEEVLWLLDDNFIPDEYMNWRFTGGKSWFDMAHKAGGREALRVEYREYIANADVITVDLGWNNFGVYAFNNIMTILKEGGSRYWKAPSFDSIINSDKVEEYYDLRDKVIEILNQSADLTGTALSNDVIKMLADVLAYATLGACYNFDKVIEKIYELNPDANVVVINIQNLADELVLDLKGIELPLGDIYGELIEFVDVYRASVSPYANKYGFAYAGEDGDVDTFLDEFRLWDGDPLSLSQDMKDLFDMYDDNLYVRSKIEYIMVGQVFAQVFAELRSTAAEYGLSAFVNDNKYTYEIPAFDMAWIENIDLASLDFNNPDTDLERYGAALSKHLINLRSYTEGGKDAYNYVFDNLIQGLTGIETLDMAIAQRNEILSIPDPSVQESYAQLIQVVTILESARNSFNDAFLAIYVIYNNTLNYAYDTVGTIIQYSLQFNTFYLTPDSMGNHNNKTNELLGYIVNTFTNNTMLKFYEELGKFGLDSSGIVAPEITVNTDLFKDPIIQAVAALEVRYDFGNSFFAHPSVKGNKQIRDAVMDVLENGTHAKEFTQNKLQIYITVLQHCIKTYYTIKHAELQANGTIEDMFSGKYTPSDDSFYVAITGENKDYANLLAGALNLKNQSAVMSWDNLDYSVLKNADFVTIGYDVVEVNKFSSDQFLAAANTYINGPFRAQVADYMYSTLRDHFSEEKTHEYMQWVDNAILSNFKHPALKGEVYAMDWAQLIGEENVPYIDAVLENASRVLSSYGIDSEVVIPINMKDLIDRYTGQSYLKIFDNDPILELKVPLGDMILLALESYLYANISLQKAYDKLIFDLVEMNPDIQIAVLSQYNPLSDITIAGKTIPLNLIGKSAVTARTAIAFSYALKLSNVTCVDITHVEAQWPNVEGFEAISYAYADGSFKATFTNEGNKYVVSQILDAYDLSCQHVYDNCYDERCNVCDQIRSGEFHKYIASVTDADCLNGGYTTYLCEECGHTYVDNEIEASGHKYDNNCDSNCNVCGENRIPSEHTFGEWIKNEENKEGRECTTCGYKEYRDFAIEEQKAESILIIVVIVVVVILVAIVSCILIKKRKTIK